MQLANSSQPAAVAAVVVVVVAAAAVAKSVLAEGVGSSVTGMEVGRSGQYLRGRRW